MRDGDIFFKRNPNDYFPPLNADQQDSLTTLLNKLIVPKPTDYSASPLLPQSVDTINSMIGAPPPVPTFNMTAPENLVATKPTEKAESPIAKAKSMGLTKGEEKPVEKQEEPKVEKAQAPEEDEYDAAKKREMDFLSTLGIVSGAEKIGQAFAQSYAPGIDFKRLEELGTKEASDILAKRKAASEKRDEAIKMQEEKERQEYRDPNSQTSENTRMLTRAMLDKAGLSSLSEKVSNMSAHEIDKKFPYLSNIINAQQAQDAKALQLSMLKAQKDEIRASKERARDEDWLTNQFQKEVESPQFKRIERFESDALNIERTLKNPGGIGEIAVLYGFLKSIDEQSAVREGEVKLGLEAMNAMEKVKAYSSNFSNKKRTLSDEMLKNIAIIHRDAYQKAKEAYNRRMKYVFNQGADRGIPKERMLRSMGMFLEGQPGQEAIPTKAQEPSSTYSDKQERGIKAFMEANNISREKAISVLKDAGRL